MDNFITIYKILSYLEKSMDDSVADIDAISPESLGVEENRWIATMRMLVSDGLIEGIDIQLSTDGNTIMTVYNPTIKLKGLEYLEGNYLMQIAKEIVKS